MACIVRSASTIYSSTVATSLNHMVEILRGTSTIDVRLMWAPLVTVYSVTYRPCMQQQQRESVRNTDLRVR
jgi:hypothetical protein